jgi:hypothetical protein
MAAPVSETTAAQVASAQLKRVAPSTDYTPINMERIINQDATLAYIFSFYPDAYVVVTALDEFTPVIAYATENPYKSDESQDILTELIRTDLCYRWQNLPLYSMEQRSAISSQWEDLLSSQPGRDYQQWPPVGYSPTGGWLKTNWTQNAPYNAMCPMDLVTGARSVAGCPSIAMGQIVNYHHTLNNTRLTDADDYHHNYSGRNYWIDNDAVALSFPTFPELNSYLDAVSQHFATDQALTNTDKAAIVFACGVAATQVYTSTGSGTFGVGQAFAAFQRFNFQDMELLDNSDTDVYDRMADSMMNALPVLLAVMTPAEDMGHNVVVDGYNTDGLFHLNFGWGGSSNGWYQLPEQFPYGMTVLEGAIVDIHPREYVMVFPDTLNFLTWEEMHIQSIEVVNITGENITIEGTSNQWVLPASQLFVLTNPSVLPCVLTPGQSMFINVMVDLPTVKTRQIYETPLRIIYNAGYYDVMIRYNTELTSPVEDDLIAVTPLSVSNSPNPFRDYTRISVKSAAQSSIRIGVYNVRGQLVRSFDAKCNSNGDCDILWDALDEKGTTASSGIYYYRVEGDRIVQTRKMLLLK